MIQVRGLAKHFHQGGSLIRAVDGVDVDVASGAFVSVIGPSGSGKSTLLHLIGCLDAPTAGEIRIENEAVSGLDDDALTLLRRRRIGFVFQFFNLLPTLTAEENVALPLLLDGRRMADIRPHVAQLLERVGLERRRTHRPDELSGGEMQRVAIARALVHRPALLLADEPTGNLDSRTGDHILTLIRESRASSDAARPTVILVTHDPRIAAAAERTITLADGHIVADTAV